MLFISHSSKDKDAALDLQKYLLLQGYEPSQLFLDSDAASGIPAGSKWEQELYSRLMDCRALIVLCSANWKESRWCFAELVFAKAMGKEVFPVLLEDCSADYVAAEHQAVFLYREGEAAYARLYAALENRHLGPTDDFGWPPKDGDQCPFPGLPAFDERHAGVYFGREEETKLLLQELRKMRANGEPRLIMIVGGSGSGKSSLLKAGVLPRLKHKMADSEWVVFQTLRYGERASEQHTIFNQLAVNAANLFPKDSKNPPDWKKIRDRILNENVKKAAGDFLEVVQDLTLARNCPDATVLIPVDQFEELLSPSAGPIADKFLKLIKELLGCRNGRLLFIGTLRSDHLDVYERSSDALMPPFFQPWRLGPFPPGRIEEVIRKPADRAHVEITDELVEALKNDTPSSEALPLLAFTLEKLYRGFAGDGKLELHEYKTLGGMEGSIQTCIERIIPKNASQDLKNALRLCFVKHLAQANEKGDVVRLTARWDDLPTTATPVLEQLINERLLMRSEYVDEYNPEKRWVSVEVAHEAMFRSWADLRKWLRTSTDILRWRRDVRRDQSNDEKWTGLSPAQLAVARDWPRSRRDELTDDEVSWISKGVSRERARRGAIIAVLLCITALAAVAAVNWRKASNEKRIATARAILALAQNEEQQNAERALAMSLHAYDLAAGTRGLNLKPFENNLRQTLNEARVRRILQLTDEVTGAAWHPDKQLLATATETGVELWQPETGNHVATAVTNSAYSALWSPDGYRLGFGLFGSIGIWTSGKPQIIRDTDQKKWVCQLAWGGAQERLGFVYLSSASPGGLWEVSDNKIEPFSGSVVHTAIASSHDGKSLATGIMFRTRAGANQFGVAIWDPDNRKPLGFLGNARSTIYSVAWSPDDKSIVAGADDGSVHLWDVKTEQMVHEFKGHKNQVMSVTWHPNGQWFFSGSFDGSIRIWNSRTRNVEAILTGHSSPVEVITCNGDGSRIASGSKDKTARVWDTESGRTPVVLRRGEAWMFSVDISPDDRLLASGGDGGVVEICDFRAGRLVKAIPVSNKAVSCVAWSPNGHSLASGSDDGTIKIWDSSTWELIHTLKEEQLSTLKENEKDVLGVSWSPGGTNVAATFMGGRIIIGDARTGKIATTLIVVPACAISWSPDGRWLAFPDTVTGEVNLWDTNAKNDSTVKLAGHDKVGMWGLAWSRDGKMLASASDDNTARIWDVKSRTCIRVLAGSASNVKCVAWSPDNKFLATGALDNSVRIWDVSTGENIAILPGHSSGVRGVKWTLDGKYLVSAGEDGRVLLSLMHFDEVVSLARTQVMIGLTESERRTVATEIDPASLSK